MDKPEPVLLIVDDESSVRRVLTRIISKKISKILTASTITDAELILDTTRVTHILCDHLLGPGQPTGIESSISWKQKYPHIEKVVILTGTSAYLGDTPEGIDSILPKTTDPLKLTDLLKL